MIMYVASKNMQSGDIIQKQVSLQKYVIMYANNYERPIDATMLQYVIVGIKDRITEFQYLRVTEEVSEEVD